MHISLFKKINKMREFKEIDVPRERGFLSLDDYFRARLGRDFWNDQDLYDNGLIDQEDRGYGEKFWILDENKERLALFKEPINYYGYESYAELISEEVCKILGMPTAHYDLAKFNGIEGVISYNFKEEYETYKEGFDIIADYYESKLKNNKELREMYGVSNEDEIEDITLQLNNLEDIWSILEEKYKDHPSKRYIVSKIVNGLVDKMIFDVMMVNIDDHCENWGQLDRELAPQFDNSRILKLYDTTVSLSFLDKGNLEDELLNLTVDSTSSRKPLDVLSRFLYVSSKEYTDLVKEKISTLKENLDEVPLRISQRTKYPMPPALSNYFTTTMNKHLGKMIDIVEGKNKSTK